MAAFFPNDIRRLLPVLTQFRFRDILSSSGGYCHDFDLFLTALQRADQLIVRVQSLAIPWTREECEGDSSSLVLPRVAKPRPEQKERWKGMVPATFDRRLEAAWHHLEMLERSPDLPGEQQAILKESIVQFSIALEELAVAQEEILEQNEELVATRHMMEAERLRYLELFDFAPDVYLVTDPLGLIQEANRATSRLLGVQRDLLVGKPLGVFVAEEDRQAFTRLLFCLKRGEETEREEWELTLQPREGPPLPAALTVAPAHDAEGEVVGLRWLLRDITSSKRAQEREQLLKKVAEDREYIAGLADALERERDTLRAIMENTHTQLAYLDPDFNFVRVNSAYASGSGHTKEELLGRNHFELFPSQENQAIFERVRDTGQLVKLYAKPFIYADQPERGITYWDWTLVPIKDERGEVVGLVFSLLDVTETERSKQERERLLAENRQQRRFLERLVKTAPIGIAVVDGADGRYELANPYYLAMPGMASSWILGRTIADVQPANAAQATLDLVEEVRRSGQVVSLREQRLSVEPEPESSYWNLDYVPLTDAEGTVNRVLILASDVSEEVVARQRIEELAVKAQRQADELATIFAAMTDGVIVYDADGLVLHANPAAVAMFGFDLVGTDRETIGRRLVKHYPDGRPVAEKDLPSSLALSGEKVIDQRLRLINSKGDNFTVLVSSAPILVDDQVAGAVLAWHDITAREEAERVGKRLIAILEQTPDMVSTVSVDGELLYLNRAGRQILGIPHEDDLFNWTIAGCYPDWAQAIIEEEGFPTAIDEGLWQGETAIVSHDGREIPMSQVVLSHKGPDGSVEYLSIMGRDISERQRYLSQLEVERARLKAVIDHAPEAIVVADRDSRIILANPAAERLYVRPFPYGQEYESHAVLALRYPDGTAYDPRSLPLTRSALDGQAFRDVEMALGWPDGQQRILLASSAPILDGKGQISGAVGVYQDITEQRRAEAALRESREKLRSLFELLPVGVAVVNQDGDVTEVNPALERILGIPRESFFRGEYLEHQYFDRDGAPIAFHEFPSTRAFREGKVVQDVEVGIVCQDGNTVWALVNAVPLPFSDWRLLLTALDITERKKAEEALRQAHDELELRVEERTVELAAANQELQAEIAERERVAKDLRASEERFRQLAEHIHEVFWMSDVNFAQILYVSPVYQELTGRSCQSLYERPDSFLDIVHPEDRQHLVKVIEEQFRESHDEEYRITLPDGSIRWVRTRSFPIRNEAGEVYRVAGISDDISDRVQARQILEQRVEERTRELATLLEISRGIALTLELEPMLTMILERLRDVVYYDGATVFKVEGGILSALVHRGPIPQRTLPQVQSSPASASLVQTLTSQQRPIIIPDVRGDAAQARSFRQSVGERIESRYAHVRSWMGLPLTVKDRTVGLLALHCSKPDYYTARQADLSLAFANQAAIAIENARLHEQAQGLAAVEERQRLARELHDAVSQTLFSASLSAEVLPRLWERNQDEGRRCLDELHRLTRGALAEMRALLLELRPAALTEVGLGDLLHQLAEAITNRARLPVKLAVDRPCPLPPDVQVALYRIAQEALNNAT